MTHGRTVAGQRTGSAFTAARILFSRLFWVFSSFAAVTAAADSACGRAGEPPATIEELSGAARFPVTLPDGLAGDAAGRMKSNSEEGLQRARGCDGERRIHRAPVARQHAGRPIIGALQPTVRSNLHYVQVAKYQ
jgi:hypothetical protein